MAWSDQPEMAIKCFTIRIRNCSRFGHPIRLLNTFFLTEILFGHFRSLAAEWGGPKGFRFNAVAPGPIYTKGAFDRLEPTGPFVEAANPRPPVRRLGEVPELANFVSYLLSPYASWMTGQVRALCFSSFEHSKLNALIFNSFGALALLSRVSLMIHDIPFVN